MNEHKTQIKASYIGHMFKKVPYITILLYLFLLYCVFVFKILLFIHISVQC